MAKVAQIAIELNLDDGNITGKLKMASGAVEGFKRSLGDTDRTLRRIDRGVNGLGASMRDLVITIGNIRGALYTLHSVSTQWLNDIIRTNAEFERLTVLLSGMSNAADPMADAGRQIAWLQDVARETPFSIQALTDTFVKFKSTGIDPMNGSMRAFNDALAAMGASQDHLHRASIAIQQMSGKGVISMEELRQQLGEAVPRATELMARALGVSYGELVKRISLGQVEAKSALNRLFQEFDRTFGGASQRQMDTFNGLIQVLKTNWQLLQLQVGEAGYFDAAKDALRDLVQTLDPERVGGFARAFGESLAEMVRVVRQAITFFWSWRTVIIDTGTVLVGAFVATRIIGTIAGIAGAMGGLVTATIGAGGAIANLTRLHAGWTTAMSTSSTAAVRLGVTLGALGAAMRGLGLAISTLAGPISIFLTLLTFAASALDLFGRRVEANYELLRDYGIVSKESLEATEAQVASLTETISDMARAEEVTADMIARLRAEGGSGQIAAAEGLEADLDRMRRERLAKEQQLAEALKTLEEGKIRYAEDVAEREADARLRALDREANQLQRHYDTREREMFERLNSEQITEEEYHEFRKESVDNLYEALTEKYKDFLLTQQVLRAMAEKSGDISGLQAAEATIALIEKRLDELRGKWEAADLSASNFGLGNDAQGADLVAAKLRQLASRVAELKAEMAGASGEAAKLQEQLDRGAYSAATPEQRAEMLQHARDIDELTEALKRQRDEMREHSAAWEQINNAHQKATESAALMRKALEAGTTQFDPRGLRNLEFQLEQARKKLIETSDEAQRAGGLIEAALSETAFTTLGEEVLDLRERTRQINIGLIDDAKARRTAEVRAEEQRLEEMLNLFESYGVDVKAFEDDIAAYRAALQEKLNRDNETAVQKLARDWRRLSENIEEASADWMGGFNDMLMEFVETGKLKFSEFAQSVIADLIRIRLQASIADTLSPFFDFLSTAASSFMGGWFGGGATATAKVAANHGGGIAGREATFMRQVPVDLFRNAERFHSGRAPRLKPNEVPTVLEKDEGVFTPEQMKALGRGRNAAPKVTLNVINRTGVQAEAEAGEMRFDGEGFVLDVVMRHASKPGPLRDMLKGG